MTITTPIWIFYLLGGVLGLGALALAALGAYFIWVFKDWGPFR